MCLKIVNFLQGNCSKSKLYQYKCIKNSFIHFENFFINFYDLSLHQVIDSDDEDDEVQVIKEIELIDLTNDDEENEGINNEEIEIIDLTRDDDQPQPMMMQVPNFSWEITISFPTIPMRDITISHDIEAIDEFNRLNTLNDLQEIIPIGVSF